LTLPGLEPPLDEIRKIAPRYKGKPENFKREKVGKPQSAQKPAPIWEKEKKGPKSENPIKGEFVDREQRPWPQQNESIISEAIFGVDVHVVPIHPRDNFSTNLSKLPDFAVETYHPYKPDEKNFDRQLIKEDLAYYSTGLMWLRLVDIKLKQGRQALTSAEKDIKKVTQDVEFNVPQPIHAFLTQIGSVTDKMGKETEVDIPMLPQTVNQGFGGYHNATINTETHNLYEEIPSLGIAGDMLMTAASPDEEPEPVFRFGIPDRSEITYNKICFLIIYTSPKGNFKKILKQLDLILQKLYDNKHNIIICGDVNINYLSDNKDKSQLNAVLHSYNLSSTVTFPTRIGLNSHTAIDNVFIDTSSTGKYDLCPLTNGLSDHDAVINNK
jgi:hypothetical protein